MSRSSRRSSLVCALCGAPSASGECACTVNDAVDDPTAAVPPPELPGSDIDDETAAFDAPNANASTSVSKNLPDKRGVLERARDADNALQGLERRMFFSVDGFSTLDQLAPLVGVNVLRAQHLAKELIARGYVRVSTTLGGDTFELQGLDDIPDAKD